MKFWTERQSDTESGTACHIWAPFDSVSRSIFILASVYFVETFGTVGQWMGSPPFRPRHSSTPLVFHVNTEWGIEALRAEYMVFHF